MRKLLIKRETMSFTQVLELCINSEKRIARIGWYEEGSFVVMMSELRLEPFSAMATHKKVNDRTAKWIGEDTPLNVRPYFSIYHKADNLWQPGWTPSTEDLLAKDWYVVG